MMSIGVVVVYNFVIIVYDVIIVINEIESGVFYKCDCSLRCYDGYRWDRVGGVLFIFFGDGEEFIWR